MGKLEPEFLAELLGGLHADDPAVIVGPGIGRDVTVLAWDANERYLIATPTHHLRHRRDRLLRGECERQRRGDFGRCAALVHYAAPAAGAGTRCWCAPIFAQIDACREAGHLPGGAYRGDPRSRPPGAGRLHAGRGGKSELVVGDGAQVGDRLLLTKGVAIEGTSIIARELRDDLLARGVDVETVRRAAGFLHEPGISVLCEARIAVTAGTVHAMHDPTEGGLATGLHELAMASGVGLAVDEAAIPILPETRRFCALLGLEPFR